MKHIIFLFALLFGLRGALAHEMQVEPVVVEVKPQKTFLTVQMEGNGEDIIQAAKVLDGERTEKRDSPFAPEVSRRLELYFNEKLLLKQSDAKLTGKIVALEYWRPDDFDYTKSKFIATLRYARDPKLAEGRFFVRNNLFDYLPNAKAILSIAGIQKTLGPNQSVDFDPAAVTTNLLRNIADFALLGIEHIFTGPDHMLFILALLLVSTSFWSLAKTLTGFTIAHSITLILSALEIVPLEGKAVELAVAASIIYVGLENIFWKNANRHRFWIAGGFGFIHGFAFSSFLREAGLPDEGLVWCLLSFNLGVEIAQIILCALAFPLMLAIKKKFDTQEQYGGMPWLQVMHIASWLVVAAGGYWMLQRVTS